MGSLSGKKEPISMRRYARSPNWRWRIGAALDPAGVDGWGRRYHWLREGATSRLLLSGTRPAGP